MSKTNKKKINLILPPHKIERREAEPLSEEALQAMDNWVQGTTQNTNNPLQEEDRQKRINFNIDETLFIKFRKHCLDQNKTVTAKMIELITKDLS